MANRTPKGGARPAAPSIFRQTESGINSEVSTLETSILSSKPENALQALKLTDDTNQPLRPAYGTQGRTITLHANYLPLTGNNLSSIYRYAVAVEGTGDVPKPTGKKLAQLINLLLTGPLAGQEIMTDRSGILLTAQKLKHEQEEFQITYTPEGTQGAQGAKSSKVYKLLVQYTKTFDCNELLTYLSSKRLDIPESSVKNDVLQAANIILGHGFRKQELILAQGHKYFPISGSNLEKSDLGSGVEMFRGYAYSVRAGTGRMLLNVQVKHMAMFRSQTLDRLYPMLNVKRGANAETLKKAELVIRSTKIKLIQFDPPRIKSICGFAKKDDGKDLDHPPKVPEYGATADQVQFWVETGTFTGYVFVSDHFRNKYNQVKSTLPVVNIGTRADPKYAIAEVCLIPPGVMYRPRLDADQTKKMISTSVRTPFDNATSITRSGFGMIQEYSQQNLQAFGWGVSKTLVQVPGRMLTPPAIQYQDRKSPETRDGDWNLKGLRFVDGKQMPLWSVLWVAIKPNEYGSVDNQEQLELQITDFKAELMRCGINAGNYLASKQLMLDNEADAETKIPEFIRRAASARLQLLLVILPKASTTIYNVVKKGGDITHGIHTVCVLGPKFYRLTNAAYFANIALKFNLKLGGRNQALKDADLGFIAEGKTMIVGLDVTHPAPGEDKAPSVSSIVASTDKNCGQWPAHISIQPPREEMVQVLKSMIQISLKRWQAKNRVFPSEIIIYRDGVGEGQYNLVRTTELEQIREGCKELYTADETKRGVPRISIIIVGKRHNTRFYPMTPENTKNNNPRAGTIVDRGVTESRIWDFYLQAHTALQGTAKPAHYVVVHDEIFRWRAKFPKPTNVRDPRSVNQRAADSLETITHNLCYLYGRATKAVSVCPPAYYADLACERARRWLSRLYGEFSDNAGQDQNKAAEATEVTVHPNLRETMFYV